MSRNGFNLLNCFNKTEARTGMGKRVLTLRSHWILKIGIRQCREQMDELLVLSKINVIEQTCAGLT